MTKPFYFILGFILAAGIGNGISYYSIKTMPNPQGWNGPITISTPIDPSIEPFRHWHDGQDFVAPKFCTCHMNEGTATMEKKEKTVEWSECRSWTRVFESTDCKKQWDYYTESHVTVEMRIEPGCKQELVCQIYMEGYSDGSVGWKKSEESK